MFGPVAVEAQYLVCGRKSLPQGIHVGSVASSTVPCTSFASPAFNVVQCKEHPGGFFATTAFATVSRYDLIFDYAHLIALVFSPSKSIAVPRCCHAVVVTASAPGLLAVFGGFVLIELLGRLTGVALSARFAEKNMADHGT